MAVARAVTVDGVRIPRDAIAAEAQNHPSNDPDTAWAEAARALVVRELLLNEARRLGLEAEPESVAPGKRETDEEALIRVLLDQEVNAEEPDEEECRAFYEANAARFRSPDLFEAAHILFAADPRDKENYTKAVAQAERTIRELEKKPELFAAIARERSDCPSGADGGMLGQVTRGQTAPEVETFLFALEEGQISPVPVKSRYGAHVLRLDRRISGEALPFDYARAQIAALLEERNWRRAAASYIARLSAAAQIDGIDMQPADGGTETRA
jgi:peptidyl-prolyl cis-trans isomerase C